MMASVGRSTLQALHQVIASRIKNKGFENCLSGVKVISGADGGCVCEMKVSEDDKNANGTLHGGMIATLVDAVSTWGLEAFTTKQGVSVDMNITYLKAVKVGDEVLIASTPLKIGRTMAFFAVDIKNKETGDILAQGRHTKFIAK